MADFYTRPDAEAADATFPSGSYTRPDADAADATFPAPTATGFLATRFGVAHVHPGWVPGWKATKFGTASGVQHWNAVSLGNIVRFSWTQTGIAVGIKPIKFGTPVATATMPTVVGVIAQAFGFTVAQFGSAAASWSQSSTVTGLLSIQFGAPAAVRGGRATGVLPTVFGTPGVRITQQAEGLLAAVFGTGRVVLTQQMAPRTAIWVRFGAPDSEQSNTYKVPGFLPMRFGRAVGFSRFNYPATGFKTCAFGTPVLHQGHRVTSIGPVIHFGDPILRRAVQC